MFKIGRFPSLLQSFFGSLTTAFHWEQHEYFQWLVLLITISWGRRNVSALCRLLDEREHPHRSRFNNFLLVARWQPEDLLRRKAMQLLADLHPQPGETVAFILDDSKKQKRGKHMDAVGWVHDANTGTSVKGHQYVTAILLFRGRRIPFGVSLYVKKEDAPKLNLPFRKTTQLAADLIRSFEPPPGVKVRVLFDSYYLCPVVTSACREKGFRFVSVLKANRNLYKNGRKLKAGKYGPGLFKRQKAKRHELKKNGKRARYCFVDAGRIDVSGQGPLRIVFSRKNGDPGVLALATDDPQLTPKQIISAYDERWHIEVFFKDAKQLLGLGQYQNRPYRAAVNHLHLVCFAYALLTHLAIHGSGEKGKPKKTAALSTGELQNVARRIVWNDMAQHLKEMPDGKSVVKELERLLVAA